MLNYDTDTTDLREQLSTQGAKEVLPDVASVDAGSGMQAPAAKAQPKNTPGLGSINQMQDEPAYLKTGQKRFGNKG